MTGHYTGNNIDYTYSDVPAVVRRIQEIFYYTKPFEYNYVVGQQDDDLIYEFAGKFQAAHSGGENSMSFGVLFLNGTMDPLTPAQIKKWQWLREVLVFDGALRVNPMQTPHKQMPGAATACPGNLIMADFAKLREPFKTAPAVPTPDPDGDEVMIGLVRHPKNPAVYIQYSNGTKRWVKDEAELGVYNFLGVDTADVKVMPNNAWMQATGVIVGPVPAGVDGWGCPK